MKDLILKIFSASIILFNQESKYPQDLDRQFIISYRLSDDMMSIFELRQRNSGIIGGKFLEASRIAKPECDPEYPDYYSPGDFAIGSTIKGKIDDCRMGLSQS